MTKEEREEIKKELRAEVLDEVFAMMYLFNNINPSQLKLMIRFLKRNILGEFDGE